MGKQIARLTALTLAKGELLLEDGAALLRRCGGRPAVLPLPVPLLSLLTELGVLVTITVDSEREDTDGELAPRLPEEDETTAERRELLTSPDICIRDHIALTVAAEGVVPRSRVTVAPMSSTTQRHTAARASVRDAQSAESTGHRAILIVRVAAMTAGRIAVGAAVVVVRITGSDRLQELSAGSRQLLRDAHGQRYEIMVEEVLPPC